MKWSFFPLALLVSLSTAVPAWADSWPPSPGCFKPQKPYRIDTQWQLDQFQDEVKKYRRCIEDFIQEQDQAILNHRKATEEAIDEWNNFVRYELD